MALLDYIKNTAEDLASNMGLGGPAMIAKKAGNQLMNRQLQGALRGAGMGGLRKKNPLQDMMPSQWDNEQTRAEKQQRIQQLIKKLMTERQGNPLPMRPPPELPIAPQAEGMPRPPQGMLRPVPANPQQHVAPIESPQQQQMDYEKHIRMLEQRIAQLEQRQPNGPPDYRMRQGQPQVRTLEKRLPEPVTAGSFANY